MHIRTICALLTGILLAAGCNSTAEEDKTVEPEWDARKITLTEDDSMTVAVDTSGDGTITVTIAEGKPDAGTYTTTSMALLEDAHAASAALGKRGATVWIRVGKNNKIAVIGWSQELQ